MSSLRPGSNNHTGLNFPQTSLRRNPYPPVPHPGQQNKQSPAPHSASPYQTQAYQPQQTPTGYPQHLFSNPPHQAQQQQIQQQQQAQQAQQQQAQQQQKPQPLPAEPIQQQQTQPQQQKQDANGSESMDIDAQANGEESGGLDMKMLADPNYIPTQPLGEMMSPPPEGGSYPTLEAVQKAVLRYCTSVGYAIVIGRSKKTVPGLKKVLFVCDRAGKPPSRVSPECRKRKTSSRKCDCPFGFFAIEQRTQWTIRYRPDPAHLQHNHGPSESPSHHPAARKLDSRMVAAVKQLKENAGAGVSETLQILQTENPDCHLLPRDIYNARAAINRNPQKVATGLAENRPAIYSKPHQSPEDRIRAELRREIAKAREEMQEMEEKKDKEISELKTKLEEKEVIIRKFEEFIDICNERVMFQRQRLAGSNGNGANQPQV
ncbi:hypothetical protein AU210_002813 [Fusarium oxysporum f. sp. radicis-cucumerinum]|uniref:PKS-NRPS hybrid synthetase n=1 Tax=Fusarium oxysporum f. sp. radicis-cucumerinum TaxID=327505 RepID=A0A2H3HZ27_FUSOX|nr:hypothetical protein AU210_002813 [Fusarium oxysporum f. sp. radicis-cucumerinum]